MIIDKTVQQVHNSHLHNRIYFWEIERDIMSFGENKKKCKRRGNLTLFSIRELKFLEFSFNNYGREIDFFFRQT